MNDRLKMGDPIWASLVAETQFAAELTLTGLRRLCSVPTANDQGLLRSKDRNYALHVGLYSYSSGLERLCKLTIACHGYVTTGKFPKLRGFNHGIGGLLDAVEALTPMGASAPKREKYLVRPLDDLDPDLIGMVDRFAGGAGRYEHLDSLWNENAEVSTFNEWSALAARASVSKEVHDLIGLKDAMVYAIGSELADDGLESTGASLMEDLDLPTYEPSVGVVLSLFRKVRWVSAYLDAATYYTGRGLPILGEVVTSTFVQTSVNFFKYDIGRISDQDVVEDELQEVYVRIRAREAEDEDFDEVRIDA